MYNNLMYNGNHASAHHVVGGIAEGEFAHALILFRLLQGIGLGDDCLWTGKLRAAGF